MDQLCAEIKATAAQKLQKARTTKTQVKFANILGLAADAEQKLPRSRLDPGSLVKSDFLQRAFAPQTKSTKPRQRRRSKPASGLDVAREFQASRAGGEKGLQRLIAQLAYDCVADPFAPLCADQVLDWAEAVVEGTGVLNLNGLTLPIPKKAIRGVRFEVAADEGDDDVSADQALQLSDFKSVRAAMKQGYQIDLISIDIVQDAPVAVYKKLRVPGKFLAQKDYLGHVSAEGLAFPSSTMALMGRISTRVSIGQESRSEWEQIKADPATVAAIDRAEARLGWRIHGKP